MDELLAPSDSHTHTQELQLSRIYLIEAVFAFISELEFPYKFH